ncbi:MAG: hypothetical protein K2X00_24180, partial [Nitrospiraceae bacterium]|nr:hypothetical protein [Nitrospiraceae bacterium]
MSRCAHNARKLKINAAEITYAALGFFVDGQYLFSDDVYDSHERNSVDPKGTLSATSTQVLSESHASPTNYSSAYLATHTTSPTSRSESTGARTSNSIRTASLQSQQSGSA